MRLIKAVGLLLIVIFVGSVVFVLVGAALGGVAQSALNLGNGVFGFGAGGTSLGGTEESKDMDDYKGRYTKYVVGFLFNEGLLEVLLIRKLKPLWQRGKLNGVGGKILPTESPLEAIRREFSEETGVRPPTWLPFHYERYVGGNEVWYFAAENADCYRRAEQQEVEPLVRLGLSQAWETKSLIYNLCYLIPMASCLLRRPSADHPVILEV